MECVHFVVHAQRGQPGGIFNIVNGRILHPKLGTICGETGIPEAQQKSQPRVEPLLSLQLALSLNYLTYSLVRERVTFSPA